MGSPALTPTVIGIGGRFALGLAALAGSLQRKEARPAPGRASDGARNRRQAGICGSLPLKAVADGRDSVAATLILANEHGPGLELSPWQVLLSCEALQEPQAVAIETAKSSLLEARNNHATKQVLAQTGGGRAPKFQPPMPLQRIEPE